MVSQSPTPSPGCVVGERTGCGWGAPWMDISGVPSLRSWLIQELLVCFLISEVPPPQVEGLVSEHIMVITALEVSGPRQQGGLRTIACHPYTTLGHRQVEYKRVSPHFCRRLPRIAAACVRKLRVTQGPLTSLPFSDPGSLVIPV